MKSEQITRRSLLRGAGAGLLGTAFLTQTRAQASPQTLDPNLAADLLWQVTLPAGYRVYEPPAYLGGSVVLPLQHAADSTGALILLDVQSRQFQQPIKVNPFPYTPILASGVLYLAISSGGLYAIEPNTQKVLWSNNSHLAANLTVLNGMILFATTDGHLVALAPQGNQLWSYYTGHATGNYRAAFSATAVNGIIVVAFDQTLYALDGSGTLLWSYAASHPITGSLSSNSQTIYFTSNSGLLIALDATTGKSIWQAPLGTLQTSAVLYGNAVYFADINGLHAFQANGAKLWNIPLPATFVSSILIEDGILYLSAGSTILAVDLASQGAKTVSYTVNSGALLVGVENGICYFTNVASTTVAAVDLGHQINQYFCESLLMADDYSGPGTSTGAQPSSTWYRTHVQLLDTASSPRSNKSVRVSVSDSLTIVSGGQTYQATPANPIWLTTDAAGELSLAVLTTDLSCPSLSLWGNFMDQQEAIVIYPDHETSNTLSDVQGGDLSKATAYDGSSMLPSGYSTADDLASAIRQTMGSTPVSLLRQGGKLKDSPSKYISFPDSTPNMLYQPKTGPTGRPYTPGSAQNWLLTLGSDGSAQYTTTSRLQKRPTVQGGISDIQTFAKNCVHGAEKVGKIAWTVVNNVVTAVVTTAENLYNLTVSAVEHAFTVVAGILKTVIGDLKKAWQWLSYILNWGDILENKDMLKKVVNGWFATMQGWTQDHITRATAAVDSALNSAIAEVATTNTNVRRALGATTVESTQVQHNNELAFVGTGIKKWYSAMHWLTSKFTDNLSRHSVSKDVPNSFTAFNTSFDNLIAQTTQQITSSSQFKNFPNVFEDFLTQFARLVSNPEQAVKNAVADIFTVISEVAELFLELFKIIADELLKAIPAFFVAVQDLLNQEISIFGISDLWKAISKDPLTLLDLVALMIAVPGTIIEKAKGSVQGSVLGLGDAPTLLGDSWFWFAGSLISTAFGAIQDLLGDAGPQNLTLNRVQLAVSGMLAAFEAPASLEDFSDPQGYTGWFLKVLVFLLQAAGQIKVALTRPQPAGALIPSLNCVAGVITSFVGGWSLSNSSFSEVDVKKYLIKMFTAIPLIAKPLKINQTLTEATATLAGVDLVFNYTATGLKTSLWA